MLRNLLMSLSLTAIVGCGAANIPETAVTPPAAPPVKAMLDDVAKSGELGSGASLIREALEAMKATDAAKADELLKEMTALEGLNDPAKIKAKAKAMSDKL
ncbi:MAG: hypothetical protein ACK58L_02330 [Planctomycetota bacterium]